MLGSTQSWARSRPLLYVGPPRPENGSWDWIGNDLARCLAVDFDVTHDLFNDSIDIFLVVKYPDFQDVLIERSVSAPLIYFPVDYFQSLEHIEYHSRFLRHCDRVVVSSPRLQRVIERHARTSYLDHHVKYTTRTMMERKTDGPILWVGVRSNLGPLVEWVNQHELPCSLLVLTNNEEGCEASNWSEYYGFRSDANVTVENWSPSRHIEALHEASAAMDVMGLGFAQWSKPATKGCDFIASGLPFAVNADSSTGEYLASYGFQVADPSDVIRWFSEGYYEETRRLGHVLRDKLCLTRVGKRLTRIIQDVMSTKRGRTDFGLESSHTAECHHDVPAKSTHRVRVAILSFLFNWPSTGGGIVHTLELAKFLGRSGFEVQHIFARNPDWGVGAVEGGLPHPHRAIDFQSGSATLATIIDAYRRAIENFEPAYVIITDSWNIKPLLAEACGSTPYILRLQALECLCPLNNVRFLPEPQGQFRQCGKHQFATPLDCINCVKSHGASSGGLHRWERELCGVGSEEYDRALRKSFRNAHAVLVVNDDMKTMLSPYSERVHVVPSGFDAERFPQVLNENRVSESPIRLLFAGLVHEWIKGFPYLVQAMEILRSRRQDVELWATADPVGPQNEWLTYIGWQSQADLVEAMGRCDVLVVPTIAQEALGRTAVEAMAMGKPVIASRLGGLKTTVRDGCNGLLANPGDSWDLAAKIERLIGDPALRQRLGNEGRRRFVEEFTWSQIIERHYRQLLAPTPGKTGHEHPIHESHHGERRPADAPSLALRV